MAEELRRFSATPAAGVRFPVDPAYFVIIFRGTAIVAQLDSGLHRSYRLGKVAVGGLDGDQLK